MSPQKRSTPLKVIALSAASALLLAACGSDTQDDQDSTNSSDTTAAPITGSLEAICEAASEESGEAVWYESSLPEQTDQIIDAFNEDYPDVDVVHQRQTGGAGLAGLVIQELQANARTADIITGSPEYLLELSGRDALLEYDMEDIGIENPDLMPTPYAVHTITSMPVIMFNTDLVDEGEINPDWDELLNEKWADDVLIWNRFGTNLVNMVPEWGVDATREYVENLAANSPTLNESTFAIGQEVGAGTAPVGLGMYHTTADVQETGAPLDMVIPEPAIASGLYSGIIQESPNTVSAQCFLGWLVSEQGAVAYEQATFRGNHQVPGTEIHDLTSDIEVSMMPLTEIADAGDLAVELNEILAN